MELIDRQENISMVKNKTLLSTLKIRWGCSPIAPSFLLPMAGVIIHNPKTRDCIMKKLVNNALRCNVSACISCYPCGFCIDLKAISCRIEWSLFQVHSPKHVKVIIFIINFITKPLCSNGRTLPAFVKTQTGLEFILHALPQSDYTCRLGFKETMFIC